MINRKTTIQKKMVEIEEEVTELTIGLELTVEEAITLYYLTHVVGGDPDNSARAFVRSIQRKMLLDKLPYLASLSDSEGIYFETNGKILSSTMDSATLGPSLDRVKKAAKKFERMNIDD